MIILSTKRLRDVRKHRKKFGRQLADILGVKRSTYVGYEKNKQEIEVTQEVAEALAEFLRVDVKDLTSQEKVENVPTLDGKYRAIEGDTIIMHRVAWDELHISLAIERDALRDIIKNNTELTQSNSRLSESIAKMVDDLLQRSRGNQQG